MPVTGGTPEEVSSGELMRRLDDVVQRLDRLSTQLEESYVRKDVQDARENATSIQIKGLEDEHRLLRRDLAEVTTDIATNRRWIISAFISPVVVAVAVVIILTAIGMHK